MKRLNRSHLILLTVAVAACGDDGVVQANTDGGTESGTDTDTDGVSMTSITDTTTSDTNDSQSTGNGPTTDPGTTSGPSTDTDTTDTGDTDSTTSDTDGPTSGTDDGSTGSTGGSTTGAVACLADDDCNDLDDACQEGICNAGQCEAQFLTNDTPCDTDLCVTGQACTDGVCEGGNAVDCSDFDTQCTIGVCNPGDGSCEAEAANEGDPCDDGMACSYDDMCAAGACIGLTTPLFEEAFADNSQGWDLEGKWEIDVAMVSEAGSISGETDPAEDHTDTADEGLAGVLVGGLSGPPGHPPQYMTSPVIDLSVLDPAADKELRFWRHLVNAAAFMTETIDVWDGSDWVNVYTSAGTTDTEWTEIVIDLDDYGNDDFQIRFGHEISNIAVGPAEPSWSVDDVAIGPVCP